MAVEVKVGDIGVVPFLVKDANGILIDSSPFPTVIDVQVNGSPSAIVPTIAQQQDVSLNDLTGQYNLSVDTTGLAADDVINITVQTTINAEVVTFDADFVVRSVSDTLGTVTVGSERTLITLQQLKDALGIVDNTSDTYLSNQIIAATEIIEKYCGREFDGVRSVFEEHEVASGTIVLDREKVSSVANVYDSNGVVIASKHYRVFSKSGIIKDRPMRSYIACNPWVTIEYTAGDTAIPMPIQEVCIDMCKTRYNNKDEVKVSGITSAVSKEIVEGVGTIEYSNFQDKEEANTPQFGSFDVMEYAGILNLYRSDRSMLPDVEHEVDEVYDPSA